MRALSTLALLSLLACGPKHAPRTMHYAELTIAGALIGVIASSAAAAASASNDTTKHVFIGVDIGFGAVALGAVGVYLLADLSDTAPPTQTAAQAAQDDAWQMTKRARKAARDGDCERVQKLAPTVKAKDASFYDVVFIRDAAIQRCLTPQAR